MKMVEKFTTLLEREALKATHVVLCSLVDSIPKVLNLCGCLTVRICVASLIDIIVFKTFKNGVHYKATLRDDFGRIIEN
ncbi:unnamed protein product [Arctia plantaginis]|uniref:Uncharacterized protein n=1 Tax=Arctia plantaginis TaxID=874455 RepID=A0A8S0Z6F1_ARCPL|nr:unnamed protein product [Arctia plantaginis]CAB3258447.1 unnamed protein product [Arctia plantaginis]